MNLDTLIVKGMTPMIELANSDGKCWLLPAHDIRTALCLYQPGSTKGKLLKQCLPTLAATGFTTRAILRRIGGRIRSLDLTPSAHAAISEAFGNDSFSWAAFGGTPSPHSKPTLQVWHDDRLLGYCKFTDSRELYDALFIHEASILSHLAERGMVHIPEVRACRQLSDGLFFFAQSTEKTIRAKSPHIWTSAHDRFIATLEAASLQRILWEDTDTYRSLTMLGNDIGRIAPHHREPVKRHLSDIMAHMQGRQVEAVTVHGDFTPWNSVLTQDGNLFVFDWEYASEAGIRGMDKCHFLVQSAIFERHLDIDSIVEELNMANTDATTLRIYLLDILSRFSAREPENWGTKPNPLADTWVALLERHI
ncbi:MAG: aminoglycoside phosphotransferase family protein [Candidatus Amulumruptor caecigallinarius]|nr:aminoglycoside phosphotransferase family protein [Candidatus Amulumruptor caecigallinarius]MCM1396279.1 aminoglycoside phosphotransferase family protein [Candidatus Amulumruptor caecigallinarius]MCM1454273.1 aminoglycoside phosphotransferase family protein [bacterium]